VRTKTDTALTPSLHSSGGAKRGAFKTFVGVLVPNIEQPQGDAVLFFSRQGRTYVTAANEMIAAVEAQTQSSLGIVKAIRKSARGLSVPEREALKIERRT
jgi:hypothetical protein